MTTRVPTKGDPAVIAGAVAKRNLEREAALRTACVLCGANPGDSCVKPSGVRRHPHQERMRDAEAAGLL